MKVSNKYMFFKNVRIRCGVLSMFIALVLCACGATELEERCFPVLTGIGYENRNVTYTLGFPSESTSGKEGAKSNEIKVPTTKEKSFKESKSKYESRLNKLVDYNHLKVIVLEEDFIEQVKSYEEMMDYLAETEEFPRNTYVCVVDDVEDLMEIEKDLPQELGTYLEEYLNNHESIKENILTLGDLMDEKENKKMILYIPFLDVEDTYVEWDGYYAIGKGMPPVKFK